MTTAKEKGVCLLGVNIDHVATVREARKTNEPDPVWGGVEAQLGGADLITLHLREDRRHISDRDLRIMLQTVTAPLNLEMSLDEEIVSIALDSGPEMVTFVPERREEITTEGGLDVQSQVKRISEAVVRFREKGIRTSLFIDPDVEQVGASADTGADGVELHTGTYAAAGGGRRAAELEKLARAASHAREMELIVNAGHGLNYNNVSGIVVTIRPRELHIGHSIVSRSIFTGMRVAVKEMKKTILDALVSGC